MINQQVYFYLLQKYGGTIPVTPVDPPAPGGDELASGTWDPTITSLMQYDTDNEYITAVGDLTIQNAMWLGTDDHAFVSVAGYYDPPVGEDFGGIDFEMSLPFDVDEFYGYSAITSHNWDPDDVGNRYGGQGGGGPCEIADGDVSPYDKVVVNLPLYTWASDFVLRKTFVTHIQMVR